MTLPKKWAYAKIDLFDNATQEQLILNKSQYKAAMNIKLTGEDGWARYWVALNSPKRHVWRRIKEHKNEPHYRLVKKIMDSMDTDYRVSKFYDEDGTSVLGLTGFLVPAEEGYTFMLVYEEQVILFELSGQGLTTAQRAKNMIASGELKSTGEVKPMKRAKDRLG